MKLLLVYGMIRVDRKLVIAYCEMVCIFNSIIFLFGLLKVILAIMFHFYWIYLIDYIPVIHFQELWSINIIPRVTEQTIFP